MALGTTGTVVTAAVVAGLAGAGAALVVGGSPGSASPPATEATRRVAELEERISKQENELRTLRSRLEEAEHARSSEARAGRGPAVMNIESREPQVVDPSTVPEGYENLPPEEKERLQKAFAEMRAKEQEEARATRLKAQDVRLRARLDRLPAELGLTAELKDSVVRAYAERGEKLRALFEEARASGNADSIRAAQEKSQAIRQDTHQALQALLTPEQLKAVEQVTDRGMPNAAGRFGARNGADRARGAAPR